MRRILFLLLLSMPALVRAEGQVSETWTAYCENSIEKIRLQIVMNLPGAIDVGGGLMTAFDGDSCPGTECGTALMSSLVALGNDDFMWTFQGWTRACLQAANAQREGTLSYHWVDETGHHFVHEWEIFCGDFTPSAIVDTVDCSLPVHTRTWGAIKALYR